MAFFVGEGCIGCKSTDCLDVCPVDAFREGRNYLVIDPEICIDCSVCEPECPVEAIFKLPSLWSILLEIIKIGCNIPLENAKSLKAMSDSEKQCF